MNLGAAVDRLAFKPLAAKSVLPLLMLYGLLAMLIIMAFSFTREFGSMTRSVSLPERAGVRGSSTTGTDDPDARFLQTRIGHILYARRADDYCRRVLFDNRTGQLFDVGHSLCRRPALDLASATALDRLQSLRKTFQK